MNNANTVFIGLDIDDQRFSACAFKPFTKEFSSFVCKPTLGAVLQKLKKLQTKGVNLKICYESTYIGFSLCRDLRAADFDCEIVASSLIPEKPSHRVKTDRLDAQKLAELYAKDLLTTIYIPTEEDEQVRDLIRTRNFTKEKQKEFKAHILSMCRRHKLNYKQETGAKSYWSIAHVVWLKARVKKMKSEALKLSFETLLFLVEQQEEAILVLENKIQEFAQKDQYCKKVKALECFRGLSTLGAMSLVVEIGDIRRFNHPKKLVSYAGMGIIEYSSGGKEKKFGITKMGNRRIRTTMVEACQMARARPAVGRRLRLARQGQPQEVIDIAQRCMWRLYRKSTQLMYSNKCTNKAKTATAREMLCFVWEVLTKVA